VSKASTKKRALFPPPATDNHLALPDFEAFEALSPLHGKPLPGNVDNRAVLVVNEVMVLTHICVKHHLPLFENLRPHNLSLDEEVQRVVDRGTGQTGTAASRTCKHLVGRGMSGTRYYCRGHSKTLWRNLNTPVSEPLCSISHDSILQKSRPIVNRTRSSKQTDTDVPIGIVVNILHQHVQVASKRVQIVVELIIPDELSQSPFPLAHAGDDFRKVSCNAVELQ
jgi:hypothetical protein